MPYPDLIFTLVLSLVVCWGTALSYRKIRDEHDGMPISMFRQKVLSLLLMSSAVLIWFGCFYLSVRYDWTRPTLADDLSGRIYSLSNHGHVVYLTMTERGLFALAFAALVCFVSGYLLHRRAG